MTGFRLYPVEQHACSFADYGAILAATRRTKARTVLEFGPGWSTLALIEGGALAIDSCESDPHWHEVYKTRLAAHAAKVAPHFYRWTDPLRIGAIDGRWYDLAFIDGPQRIEDRPACIAYAIDRCARVLVALEEHDTTPVLRDHVFAIANRAGRSVTIERTGPFAGAYALIS